MDIYCRDYTGSGNNFTQKEVYQDSIQQTLDWFPIIYSIVNDADPAYSG